MLPITDLYQCRYSRLVLPDQIDPLIKNKSLYYPTIVKLVLTQLYINWNYKVNSKSNPNVGILF